MVRNENKALDTWEKQKEVIRERMIKDIEKSIILDREKMRKDMTLEPFSFENLINSARNTIWIPDREFRLLCAEALFRTLDPRDYRYEKKDLLFESLK